MSGSDSPTFFHGQPWSSWIEKIGRDKPLSDDEPDTEPASSVMRLSVDDIDLYGFCPERDTFYGVVCEICNSIVKPQALFQHMESRHPSGTSNLPPPSNSTTKPPMKTPYCKLSKLKKSQSSGQLSITNNNSSSNSGNGAGNGGSNNANSNSKTSNNHTPVKQRTGGSADQQTQQQTQQAQQPSSLHAGSSPRSPLDSAATPSNGNGSANPSLGQQQPAQHQHQQQQQPAAAAGGFANALSGAASGASPVKSPGNQPKRKRLKTERSLLKDREYDPDRHCGVRNEETGKPCTRSLTCKAHTVSLRRTVQGRSKSFDKLLADHRAAKESPTTRITQAKPVTASANASGAQTAIVAVTAVNAGAVAAEPISASNAPMVAVNIDAASVTVSNSLPELDAPSSPPVLSLPDTYPLPQAVDLLYRCLAPHGSNKPTKLEEDFANELDSSRRVEPSVVNSNNSIATSPGVTSNVGSVVSVNTGSSNTSNAVMTPISGGLPSLSPIQSAGGGGMSPGQAASLLQYSRSASSPISMEQMLGKQQQQQQSPISAQVAPGSSLLVGSQPAPVAASVVLEAKTAPMDIDVTASGLTSSIYVSPVHPFGKEGSKSSQLSARSSQSPSSRSSSYSGLFDATTALLETQSHNSLEAATTAATASRANHLAASLFTNGKQRLSNHLQQHVSFSNASPGQQLGRGLKQEYVPDYSTAIQLEATAASTPYAASFDDITWSSHHPEPLAVSKWLRITSSRKQYNFNIH